MLFPDDLVLTAQIIGKVSLGPWVAYGLDFHKVLAVFWGVGWRVVFAFGVMR